MDKASNQAFVYVIRDGKTGRNRHYVSPISHDVIFRRGLPAEAIMGELVDGPDLFDAEHFAPNAAFIDFLHKVIARHAVNCPDLVAEVRRQQEGYVLIVDGRTPTPEGDVSPEDIIGAVVVRAGNVTGYQGNPNYRIFTACGLMKLDSWFQSRLSEEISRRLDKST